MNLEALRHAYLRWIIAPTLRALGMRATTRIATAFARGVYQLRTPGRHIAEQRLSAFLNNRIESTGNDAPDFGSATGRDSETAGYPDEFIARMYQHIARFWVEVLFARRLMRADGWESLFDFENRQALERLAADRRGCLLATGYYGSLTMGAFALGQIFRPIHVIADAATQPGLAAWQQSMYRIDGVRIIDRRDAAGAVPEVLQRGGAVLMVCEQARQRGRGVPVNFLGSDFHAYPTVERLARWFDATVAVVTCRRESQPRRFTLSCHSTHECNKANDADGDGRLTRDVLDSLQRAICRDPSQYLWSVPVGSSPINARSTGRRFAEANERAPDAIECAQTSVHCEAPQNESVYAMSAT